LQLADLFWQAVRGGKFKREPSQLVSKELKSELDVRQHGLQKVLLGMLVHYPDFLDEKQDKILRLKFVSELDKFCTALYKLLVVQKHLSVLKIYEHLEDGFYNVLQEIHGKREGERPWGHNLFFHFPILALDPPRDFISRCIDHFARRIHLSELDEDVQRAKTLAGENDAAVDQLLNLVRERQSEHANIEAEGSALAEEAADIRRLWGPNPAKSQDAALQHFGEALLA